MSVAASKCGEGRCAMQKVGKEGKRKRKYPTRRG
jgi:hypothetical protein